MVPLFPIVLASWKKAMVQRIVMNLKAACIRSKKRVILLYLPITARQNLKEKRMLWCYLQCDCWWVQHGMMESKNQSLSSSMTFPKVVWIFWIRKYLNTRVNQLPIVEHWFIASSYWIISAAMIWQCTPSSMVNLFVKSALSKLVGI